MPFKSHNQSGKPTGLSHVWHCVKEVCGTCKDDCLCLKCGGDGEVGNGKSYPIACPTCYASGACPECMNIKV